MTWLVALLLSGFPQEEDPQAILRRYQSARPREDSLAIYKLDWAPDFKSALKEKRPVFLVATRQLEDAGSLYSGHC